MNNLIIKNAHIITPRGHMARCGDEMKMLHVIPRGTIEITDGRISYVGENLPEDKTGYEIIDAKGNVALPGFVEIGRAHV